MNNYGFELITCVDKQGKTTYAVEIDGLRLGTLKRNNTGFEYRPKAPAIIKRRNLDALLQALYEHHNGV